MQETLSNKTYIVGPYNQGNNMKERIFTTLIDPLGPTKSIHGAYTAIKHACLSCLPQDSVAI